MSGSFLALIPICVLDFIVVQWEIFLCNYFWEPTQGAMPKPPWDDGGNPKKIDDNKKEEPTLDCIGCADRDNPKFEYFKD